MVKIRTLNFHKWELEEIEKYDHNRSNYIREALAEELLSDKQNGLFDKEPGLKITTVSMGNKLHKTINKLNKKGVYVSFSEFARRAVRNKLIRDGNMKVVGDYRDSLPKDMVYIPSINGGIPFRTRRLE